ncbi:BMP family ABC transporter substrate-binding protein [Zobellella endophytica]|uniref:BMP family ABC transporter substrate-binding protein n=1 Tax=Zobellella endophytica TaxID=2116700 RepID=A0A2P7R823_9GAMM|nr:BMP family protein [Zobellella endophytica]PSJ46375.1 BMP family ABC transporter substrate-binding protein [Zobellella endophytica]
MHKLGSTALLAAGLALAPLTQALAQDRPDIAVLIPGKHDDNGFMQAAYRGYEKIKAELDVNASYVSNISATSDPALLTEAMRKLAQEGPDLIIAHGGQCNGPAEIVSKEFPDIRFVVIQGHVQGPNLSSYVVRQEDSAWLAGALAGLTTQSDVVGHISGAWPKPGLIGRAAFYDGVKHVNPDARFLTWFTGDLDNTDINAQAAAAEIAAGADVIYTMLNAGRQGVIDEIKSHGGKVRHIGNVSDWTQVDASFVGSAVADASVAILSAARDFTTGDWQPDQITEIGLGQGEVVKLTLAEDVSPEIRQQLDQLAAKLISGEIRINTTYEGSEFNPATGEFVDQSYKEELKAKS